jgi:hypothetical protein
MTARPLIGHIFFIIIFLSSVRPLACSVFTMPTSFLDVPHLFYLEIIFEGDLRDL